MSEPNGQPQGVNLLIGKSRMQLVGADVNINLATYVSRITGYNDPINLNSGTTPDHGKLKKIYNETGGNIVINSSIPIQGASTNTITLSSNGWIELIYLNDPDISEKYREIDGQSYTLS